MSARCRCRKTEEVGFEDLLSGGTRFVVQCVRPECRRRWTLTVYQKRRGSRVLHLTRRRALPVEKRTRSRSSK